MVILRRRLLQSDQTSVECTSVIKKNGSPGRCPSSFKCSADKIANETLCIYAWGYMRSNETVKKVMSEIMPPELFEKCLQCVHDERSSNNTVAVATGTALLLVGGSRCDILEGEECDKGIHW